MDVIQTHQQCLGLNTFDLPAARIKRIGRASVPQTSVPQTRRPPRESHVSSSSSLPSAYAKLQWGLAHRQNQVLVCRAVGTFSKVIEVKIGLAHTSQKLDLSECELEEVPESVFDVADLEELSLAGNQLRQVPEALGRLTTLRRLTLAGNRLTCLPDSLAQLTNLEGLWLHGNLLRSLPPEVGALTAVRTLSACGNRLEELPESIGQLSSCTDLNLAGNKLRHIPAQLDGLSSLQTLSLNGNQLQELPREVGRLSTLKGLWLQCNQLQHLPETLLELLSLKELNIAENRLTDLPLGPWANMTQLRTIWMYGNQVTRLPTGLRRLPELKHVWVEDNPLTPDTIQELFGDMDHSGVVGLDQSQVAHMRLDTKGTADDVGHIVGSGRGYFKLVPGHRMPGDAIIAQDGTRGERVLVVAFASAPGVPNFGGLLRRIYNEATEPAHRCFDVLYVVDGARGWYDGGDDGVEVWRQRLALATSSYKRVMMLGDSMGATAGLLFAPLATAVQVFTPQVDLCAASLRPGRESSWLQAMRARIIESVSSSAADITVHVGNFTHDLDQVKPLPEDKLELKVYSVDSHRLAFYLDTQKKLLPVVRAAILNQMGFKSGNVRLQNLV